MAAASEVSREELLEILRPECAVCLLPYDDSSRTPRLLSCGHSISQDCADLLIDSNYSPAGGEAFVGFGRNGPSPLDNAASSSPSIPPEGLGKIVGARFGVVKCPECNQRTKVPAKGARGLAKNIELLRVISKLEGNDGSAKARKADLERNVNWEKEIAAQAAVESAAYVEPGGNRGTREASPGQAEAGQLQHQASPGQEAGVGTAELNEGIQTEAASWATSANGHVAQGAEAPNARESVPLTGQSAYQAGSSQQAGVADSPEQEITGAVVDDAEIAQIQPRQGPPPLEVPHSPHVNGAGTSDHAASRTESVASESPTESAQLEAQALTQLHSLHLGHQDSVSALAVVADQWLCSASFDRTVRVWSVADGSPHGILEGHQHRIMALATVSLLPEETSGVDEDGILCGNGRIIDNYLGGGEAGATIPQGADLLVSADYGGHIKVWSVIRDTRIVQGVGESPNSTEEKPAVSSGVPSAGPGKLLASWDAHADWRYFGVLALAVADGKVLYSGAGDRTIRAWSLGAGGVALGGLLGLLEGHTGPVSALAVDGELLYSGSWDGSVRGWWREDHTPVAVVHAGPGPGVRCLAMVGPRLVAGRDDGTLQSWIEGQPDSQKAKAHGGVVSTMCVYGRYLYTGSWDGVIQVWLADAPFGPEGPVATMQVEGGPLAVVHALAAGGGRLFSAHLDTGIKVWTGASS